jgi:hypothetical protein
VIIFSSQIANVVFSHSALHNCILQHPRYFHSLSPAFPRPRHS